MVIDAAKGIETQTRKLFEVCRLRDVPIVTFINKMDREGRDPFELLDEIEQDLQLEVTPGDAGRSAWAATSSAATTCSHDQLILMERGEGRVHAGGHRALQGLDDPEARRSCCPSPRSRSCARRSRWSRELCPQFDLEVYREGHLTPVFFGSAVNNFGVRELLDGRRRAGAAAAPAAGARARRSSPTRTKVSGFVFKIQANMDPKHRDRIAFVRLVLGPLQARHEAAPRRAPARRMASTTRCCSWRNERELAEEAWAGDIIGIPNHGTLRIGDALTEGEALHFTGIPSFAPEFLRRVRADDPMKAKHLGRALEQIAEEGAAQVFKLYLGSDCIVGVVGALQFDVLADRIAHASTTCRATSRGRRCRSRAGSTRTTTLQLKKFADANHDNIAEDHTGAPVFLARNEWHLKTTSEEWPAI